MAAAKKYWKVLKRFAYADAEGNKVYVERYDKDENGSFVYDSKGRHINRVCELPEEAIKVGEATDSIVRVKK